MLLPVEMAAEFKKNHQTDFSDLRKASLKSASLII